MIRTNGGSLKLSFEIILWLTPSVFLFSFSIVFLSNFSFITRPGFRFILHVVVRFSRSGVDCCAGCLCQWFLLRRLYLDVWQTNIIAFAEFTDICISWILSVKVKWWDISMQWREYMPAERRSYLSAIRHYRFISKILNCKAALILAEMKAVTLILSVVWTKAIYIFAKVFTC